MELRKIVALVAGSVLPAAVAVSSDKNVGSLPDWQNPAVSEVNRLPMRATFVTDQQKTLTLNGVWKFNLCDSPSVAEDAFTAESFDDSAWGTMPVPGMWELNGYVDPVYLDVGYAWRGHFENNPPFVSEKDNYVGQYRRTFDLPEDWDGKQIRLCVGSATSNVRLWVNGKFVGYSEDSKLEACFDITRYVQKGHNFIAMEIYRWCDGTYLEDQDFWRFSGIARGMYLFTREKDRIEDVNVRGEMDGKTALTLTLTPGITSLSYEIIDPAGKKVYSAEETLGRNLGKDAYGNRVFRAEFGVASPELWSAETPSLYTLKVSASGRKGLVESTSLQFGYRTVAIRNNQLLVNGQPILIKGVDRHEMSTHGGYVVTEEEMLRDIKIMKELNINAVRTSHYPNDPLWYTLCDKFGIYVVDEANVESHGMGYGEETLAAREDFFDMHLVRNQRMVYRDYNHPSIIVWSMGNEAGDGSNFEKVYDWIKSYDSSRPVQYERAYRRRHTDIWCPMYASPERCENYLKGSPTKPLILCEYSHAMGNSCGNLKEYWDLVRKYPEFQGGFIWDFADQALYRKVGDSEVFAFGGDFNDYDPSDGSFNCNGIVSADRHFHPQAYEVRYQYRSIHTSADSTFRLKSSVSEDNTELKLKVYNENFFLPLSGYRMVWSVEAGGEKVLSGVCENVDLAPGETGYVSLGITMKDVLQAVAGATNSDSGCATFHMDTDISIDASWQLKSRDGILPAGFEVAYDQIRLYEAPACAYTAGSAAVAKGILPEINDGVNVEFSGKFTYAGLSEGVRVADWAAVFDKVTGALTSYKIDGTELLKEALMPSFGRAPVENDLGAKLHVKSEVWRYPVFELLSFNVEKKADRYVVTTLYEIPVGQVSMTYDIFSDGSLSVSEKMIDTGELSKAPDLFRYGMKFAMPGDFSTMDFYGLGPWDNYCDRNSSALLGHYTQRVEDQYWYGYVRTQESGTKTGLRWLRVTDGSGMGLEVTSDIRFSGSALPFSQKDMDSALTDPMPRPNPTNGQSGNGTHSLELLPLAHNDNRTLGTTYVNFDMKEAGVGGINSWGALPMEDYRVHPAEYDFRFVLRPVR